MIKKKKKVLLISLYFIGFSILFFISYFFIIDFKKANQINKEIQLLHEEIYNLENHNVKLTELIKYFDSEGYAEQKARLELGLKKPGETVVIIPRDKEGAEDGPIGKEVNMKQPNYIKWWKYFFQNSESE